MKNDKKIIVALDSDNISESLNLVDKLKKEAFAFKIGYEFFYNFGLIGYKKIKNKKVKIFLDLKLHDIPNTVKKGIIAINKLSPYFTSIHISGGDQMQIEAMNNKKRTKILGISLLTSMDEYQTKKYYNSNTINKLVKKFVLNAMKNNIDGVVCSPHEIKLINKLSSKKLIIVTPGIRPDNYVKDDQKRFMTPQQAINLGANYLVIGRPITKSPNPLEEIISINSSIE